MFYGYKSKKDIQEELSLYSHLDTAILKLSGNVQSQQKYSTLKILTPPPSILLDLKVKHFQDIEKHFKGLKTKFNIVIIKYLFPSSDNELYTDVEVDLTIPSPSMQRWGRNYFLPSKLLK